MKNLKLSALQKSDCHKISKAFQLQGWDKPISQFEKYLEYQQNGVRDIIVAKLNGTFTGYLTINWKADYRPFREDKIPEISDFNVLRDHQRKGIGTLLMNEAERRIKDLSRYAGIGFGVYEDYGAAQALYIRRGYIPDGRGITKDSIPIKYGEVISIDDSIVICLVKQLY